MVDHILDDAASGARPVTYPAAYYSEDGDCVFVYVEDSAYARDRVDSLLTVYRSLGDRRRVIGLQIKGIKRLVSQGVVGVQLDTGGSKKGQQINAVHLLLESYKIESGQRDGDRTGAYAEALQALGCRPVPVELQMS